MLTCDAPGSVGRRESETGTAVISRLRIGAGSAAPTTVGVGKSMRIFARFRDARTSDRVTPFVFLHNKRINPESSFASSASMLRLTLPSMKWTFHNSSRSRPCICSFESRWRVTDTGRRMGKHVIAVRRESVFAGTVNHDNYLKDETGGHGVSGLPGVEPSESRTFAGIAINSGRKPSYVFARARIGGSIRLS